MHVCIFDPVSELLCSASPGSQAQRRPVLTPAQRPQQMPKRAKAAAASPSKKPRPTGADVRYSGYTLPAQNTPIERRAVSSLTPEQFFAEFVATRRPVVLTGAAALDPAWRGTACWSNAHLREVAGADGVRVERRAAAGEAYGKGQNVRMAFGELLTLLEQGDARHYMTTQDLSVDEEGRPALMSTPCTQLHAAGDFPLVPSLLGSLLPMNYNLWLGNTVPTKKEAEGSSSGLHHDFHDNLYVLLRGRKRFRLFAPLEAPVLYTVGAVAMVHENGRICYEGALTNADGSDAEAVAAMQAELGREAAEQELDAAEAAVEAGEAGAAKQLEQAEEALEAAMEAGLNAELGMDGDDDGFSDEDGDEGGGGAVWGAGFTGKDDEEDDEEEEEPEGGESEAAAGGEDPECTPDNFCAVDLNDPQWRTKWELAGGATMTECTVEVCRGNPRGSVISREVSDRSLGFLAGGGDAVAARRLVPRGYVHDRAARHGGSSWGRCRGGSGGRGPHGVQLLVPPTGR